MKSTLSTFLLVAFLITSPVVTPPAHAMDDNWFENIFRKQDKARERRRLERKRRQEEERKKAEAKKRKQEEERKKAETERMQEEQAAKAKRAERAAEKKKKEAKVDPNIVIPPIPERKPDPTEAQLKLIRRLQEDRELLGEDVQADIAKSKQRSFENWGNRPKRKALTEDDYANYQPLQYQHHTKVFKEDAGDITKRVYRKLGVDLVFTESKSKQVKEDQNFTAGSVLINPDVSFYQSGYAHYRLHKGEICNVDERDDHSFLRSQHKLNRYRRQDKIPFKADYAANGLELSRLFGIPQPLQRYMRYTVIHTKQVRSYNPFAHEFERIFNQTVDGCIFKHKDDINHFYVIRTIMYGQISFTLYFSKHTPLRVFRRITDNAESKRGQFFVYPDESKRAIVYTNAPRSEVEVEEDLEPLIDAVIGVRTMQWKKAYQPIRKKYVGDFKLYIRE